MDWQFDLNSSINESYVRFAKRLLQDFPSKYEVENQEINRGDVILLNNDKYGHILKNIAIYGSSEKFQQTKGGHQDRGALFCYDDVPLTLHYSTYRIRFMVPKTNVVDCVHEMHEPGDMTLTDWAYNNCYLRSINKILENHGIYIFGLTHADPNAPMLKYSPYWEMISILRIERNLNEKNEGVKIEVA